MPKPVEPWTGVKSAVNYGFICPTLTEDEPFGESFTPPVYWPKNENCQYLNIWSMSLDNTARKPVMVWLHGGGFTAGASNESVIVEGSNLAAYGDVVVVTLNHRVNILGYFDMSAFGERYTNSVNAGMADIVEALRWIRDNIINFGGDPDNVTIFGQSGGGGKVATLLQIPEAAGLFHKAIIMSGIAEGLEEEPVEHKLFANLLLEDLGIAKTSVQEIGKVPFPVLARAFRRMGKKVWEQKKILLEWGPVANGWYIGDPMKVGFAKHAKKIPIVIGSTIAEHTKGLPVPEDTVLSPEEKRELIAQKFGAYTDELITTVRQVYPDKNELCLLNMDCQFRLPSLDYVAKKSEVSNAPAYIYLFAVEYDHTTGRIAQHGADVAYAFHNIDKVFSGYIEGCSEYIEDAFCGAFVNFAKNSNPNNIKLPHWPAYNQSTPVTMQFDRGSCAREDHDRTLVGLLNKATPKVNLKEMFAHMHGYDLKEEEKIYRY